MSATYFTLLTTTGESVLATATAQGSTLHLTQMAVGDGNGNLPTPETSQTRLVNERRRAPLNTLSIDPNNPNQIIAEQVLPEDVGGWWIREIGLYDEHNRLIAVGNCPPTYKPQLSEGSGRTQIIRMVLIVSSIASVELKIDPAVVLATRQYVDDAITIHAQSHNHPDATLTAKGFTQLSSATNSGSETMAATPKAVKVAMDKANAAAPASHNHPWNQITAIPDGTTAQKGVVKLNNATNSTSTTEAATPSAVKAAYDLAKSKILKVNNKTGEIITLTAADVDAVSAQNGGSFQKPISAAYAGPFAWADQYGSTAAFHNDFTTTQASEYHPVLKQKATIAGKTSYAFSFGALVNGTNLSFHLHMKGSAGHDMNYTFATNGDFRAPASVGAGASGVLAGDGNLHGSIWGGWLSNWLHHNTVRDVRLGAVQWTPAWRGGGFGDEWGYVITGVVNNNRDDLIDTIARRPLQKYIAGNWYTVASI